MVTRPGVDWAQALSATVGAEVRRRREELGLLGKDVEEYCASTLKFDMPRSTLSKIETGSKAFLSLAELLVLAAALDTSPALLLAPFTRGGEVEVLPDRRFPVDVAFSWVSGESVHPPSTWPDGLERRPEGDARVMAAHRAMRDRERHRRITSDLGRITGELIARRRAQIEAESDGDMPKARGLAADIDSQSRRADHLWVELRDLRQHMSSYGYVPPPLQGDLAQREADPDNALPWGL